ncbi:MAG: sulfotransferase [Vicinamibacteraceae bacterium]
MEGIDGLGGSAIRAVGLGARRPPTTMTWAGVRYWKHAARFHLERLALDSGIVGGRSDYRRFIILGRGRTGSNFLRGLLNSHSQIVTFGELFRFYDSIGWEFPDYDRHWQGPGLIALMQANPARFLETKVFSTVPKRVAAVGFKLFYYHAQDDSRRAVWMHLKERRDTAVIHLRRNNTLRMILSEKKAFKTDNWTNTTGAEEEPFATVLDYEECLHRFEHELKMAEECERVFHDHPRLTLTYELLSEDFRRAMPSVLEFLGVKSEPLRPATYKQARQPLAEAILNYGELKGRFRNTPWGVFFDE